MSKVILHPEALDEHADRRLQDAQKRRFDWQASLVILGDMAGLSEAAAASEHARGTGTSPFEGYCALYGALSAHDVATVSSRLGLGSNDPATPLSPLDAPAASAALRTGVLRLADGRLLFSARPDALTRLVGLIVDKPAARTRVKLVTAPVFVSLVMTHAAGALARQAARGPAARHGALSAERSHLPRLFGLALLGMIAVGFTLPYVGMALHVGVAAVFFALAALRLYAVSAPAAPGLPVVSRHGTELPVYTVLVPLYQEAAALPGLLVSLSQLDYPADRLDIKLLMEPDDRETWAALAEITLPPGMEAIILPPGTPRTKPRALNIGLAAARGEFLVVYDAEDRPEPDQMRVALGAFDAGGEGLACVQARLSIDNTRDSWLTRHFTIEYAALFDIFLPALARQNLFLPLGGTSNHFRTAGLRAIGGWDAHNVTEDVDLALRLVRCGYRLDVISSTTYEEAPNRPMAWLRQRTRWLKGFMVTWSVHMSQPLTTLRVLGWRNFIVFQALVAGVPLAALVHPYFLLLVAWRAAEGLWPPAAFSAPGAALLALDTFNLIAGYAAITVLSLMAIEARGLKELRRSLWTLPLYWLCMSVAAWRAVGQLIFSPTWWEKTPHGFARSSRTGALAGDLQGRIKTRLRER